MASGNELTAITMSNERKLQTPLQGNWLIISDLDGTLLDHFDYSHSAADKLLAQLDIHNIPVVINSSKTAPEIIELRHELNNQHPFIVENGSAIYLPRSTFTQPPSDAIADGDFWILELGVKRDLIAKFLSSDAEQFDSPYQSFANSSVEEIRQATDLSTKNIEQAMRRSYSEPLLWRGDDEQKHTFCQRARHAGFTTLQGGRFLHVLGRCNKGSATKDLVDIYERHYKTKFGIIAAGDSPNDSDMLKVADIAVLIRSPAHAFFELETTAMLIHSHEYGPRGWNEVVGKLFDFDDSSSTNP